MNEETKKYRAVIETIPEVATLYGVYRAKSKALTIKYLDSTGKVRHSGLVAILKKAKEIDPSISAEPFEITCQDCGQIYFSDKAARKYCYTCSLLRPSVNRKNSGLKTEYGLTREQYDKMLLMANNSCQMCGVKDTRLVVDHDHETNEVRGILCVRCNSCLGWYEKHGEQEIQNYLNMRR